MATRDDDAYEASLLALAGVSLGEIIPVQERRGQQEQARAQTLPLQGPRAVMEQLGFVFGEPVDDLFVQVQFPPGWRKAPTDHAMWSDLLDAAGRKRGAIFYKAAFYDRAAHYRLEARYQQGTHYGDLAGSSTYDHEAPYYIVVRDTATGAILWHSAAFTRIDYKAPDCRVQIEREEAANAEARAWLAAQYPDHADPVAYWDSEA